MIKKIRRFLIFMLFCLIISSCNSNTTAKVTSEFPFDLMVNIYDLGNQFSYWGSEFPENENAFTYSVSYRNQSEGMGAFVTHDLAIYPDSIAASEAFPNLEEKWFNENWSRLVETTYQPKNSDDQYRLECMDVLLNDLPSKNCRMLQLHNNLIILVLTNITPDNITFATFEEILTKLDERLPEEEIPVPSH